MTSPAQLLSELIAIPSVNPAFAPAGDPRAVEKNVADYLASVAARGGLDVDLDEVLPTRANVLARLLPAGKVRQRIVLAPHMVPVP